MNYKSELQSNNTDLQSILDTVNALPDAGSSIDFVTVHTGADAPTADIGADGDLYLVVTA